MQLILFRITEFRIGPCGRQEIAVHEYHYENLTRVSSLSQSNDNTKIYSLVLVSCHKVVRFYRAVDKFFTLELKNGGSPLLRGCCIKLDPCNPSTTPPRWVLGLGP